MSQVTARRYAVALYDAIVAKSNAQQINEQVEELLNFLAESKQFTNVITSPVIQSVDKEKLITTLFSKKVDTVLLNFMFFLIRKRRINLCISILEEYLVLLDSKSGKINSEVISAVQLSQKQIEKIKEFLQKNISKNINISNKIDKSLQGGYLIKIGDLIVDQSVKNHIQKLKARLLAG